MTDAGLRALVCVPLILGCGGGAMAGQPRQASQNAITVMAEPLTVNEWSVRIGRELDGHLDYPKPMGTGDYLQGVSKITFQCTDDGVPGNVTLAQSSGSHLLDQAALKAVNRLSTLHPLPEGVQSGQHVVAWVVLAQDEANRDRMMQSLRRDAQVANAVTAHRIADRRNPADRPAIVVASR